MGIKTSSYRRLGTALDLYHSKFTSPDDGAVPGYPRGGKEGKGQVRLLCLSLALISLFGAFWAYLAYSASPSCSVWFDAHIHTWRCVLDITGEWRMGTHDGRGREVKEERPRFVSDIRPERGLLSDFVAFLRTQGMKGTCVRLACNIRLI
jgi:hypothetical protein